MPALQGRDEEHTNTIRLDIVNRKRFRGGRPLPKNRVLGPFKPVLAGFPVNRGCGLSAKRLHSSLPLPGSSNRPKPPMPELEGRSAAPPWQGRRVPVQEPRARRGQGRERGAVEGVGSKGPLPTRGGGRWMGCRPSRPYYYHPHPCRSPTRSHP
jgi:hypothetical protein